MILEYLALDLGECRFDRLNLRQHINAIAAIVDHLRHAAHLPLDPAQAIGYGFSVSFRH